MDRATMVCARASNEIGSAARACAEATTGFARPKSVPVDRGNLLRRPRVAWLAFLALPYDACSGRVTDFLHSARLPCPVTI